MEPLPKPTGAEVFISYSSRDREQVLRIVRHLEDAGVSVWLDQNKIDGATKWAEQIVLAIEASMVVLLGCSDASMRSWAVKSEIQLAAECQRAFLPLILKQTSFPAQMRFCLAGWQWIEVLDRPAEQWLPKVLAALRRAGVQCRAPDLVPVEADSVVESMQLTWDLEGLWALAPFTDQVWPVPAERTERGLSRSAVRGLGAPQPHVRHGYPLGSKVRLIIESEQAGHLLLLDKGPEGKLYCLCPSSFAPDTRLPAGRSALPQQRSPYPSFLVTGEPGLERLLAIVTGEPLDLGWMPKDPQVPARVLDRADTDTLLRKLRSLGPNRWTALSTYFDVTA